MQSLVSKAPTLGYRLSLQGRRLSRFQPQSYPGVHCPSKRTSKSPLHLISQHPRTMATTNGTPQAPEPTKPSPDAFPTWQSPGHVSFDFRSDTVTTPTARMLEAISNTSLGDDVFEEDSSTIALEAWLAEMSGHEAGLLVVSGTMGNQVSLRAHLGGPPHAVLCDSRAHVLNYEAGGAASLAGAVIQPVEPANGRHITLDEVRKKAVLGDNVHLCPTRVVELENTLGGCVMPLDEVKRISAWARENGLIMHLDGARLWEAVAAGAGSLKEYCQCFDTVSLCLSKGLGAPIGSVIVGPKSFIKRARHIRKMLGGGTRQIGILSSAAKVAVEDVFLGGKLKAGHEVGQRIGSMWEKLGGRLELPVETNMVWLDLTHADILVEQWREMAKEEGLKVLGGRLVVHHQICDEAISRLQRLFERIWDGKNKA